MVLQLFFLHKTTYGIKAKEIDMSLLELASGASAWRGYDYCKSGKVKLFTKLDENRYEGFVSGSKTEPYHVVINLGHPRSSQCDCPHANGKRIVCKHMVALYFAAFPQRAEQYYKEVIKAEEEAEREQERLENALIDFVSKMKKEDLRQALLQTLFEGPEWQFDRFIQKYLNED